MSEWSDPNRVAEYLSREIPHRQIAESLLLDALPDQIECFLDLGTGDGRLLVERQATFAVSTTARSFASSTL